MRIALLLRVLAWCFMLLATSAVAQASDFEMMTQSRGQPRIRMTGMIVPGDSEKLRALLEKISASAPAKAGEPLGSMEMSSMGGDLNEGFQIGHLLRKYRVIAIVRQHDLCMSSCAFAFLGGNA